MPANVNFKKLGDTGEALLLLHGWQHSIENLWPLAKCLSAHYQVYVLDFPGFGASPYNPQLKTTADYVQVVNNFVQEQKIKPILLGHSFGGRIAVKLAALYSENFAEKLILIGTPGLRQKRKLSKKLYFFFLKYLGKTLKIVDAIFRTNLFKNKFAPRYGSTDYQNAGELKNLFVQVVNEDLSPFAVKVRQKTLLLWGKHDFEAPLEQARGYQKLITNANLQVLPFHGHEPFADVGAHYVAKLVREFLDD